MQKNTVALKHNRDISQYDKIFGTEEDNSHARQGNCRDRKSGGA